MKKPPHNLVTLFDPRDRLINTHTHIYIYMFAWQAIVLIPKSVGGYRGIELVEAIWKVCALIVKNRLRSTTILYDALHGLRQGGGTGTVIMESNIEQKLEGTVHEQMFKVFIEIQTAYNSLDRWICMKILRGYGLGPNIQKIIQIYWDRKNVVPKAGRFLGDPFNMERGVTQGGPISPKIFNIVVNAVVRAVLLEF